ncbi:carboxypeptidase-like regulatory domain-containing protein [Haloterrigena alkaliphila]|uniref:Carboxypeptidase regulatory-like domain-containing protein n=1 Tax=Haloterrigena alkaliphila TaxID=2816475 RepID=A0A8A2VBJ0_9EURY|nr:carboxypeptidase-like regulatory domain-containing protein [Haloterrigena alkaliphila]QSW99383.1 carboxypeptidase-like regulatory domain-containing protein [Haloterrigena alkaliphila]
MNSNRRRFLQRSSLVTAGLLTATGTANADARRSGSAATGRVAGTITYGPQPVADVTVTLDGERGTKTEENGSFELDVGPGTYALAARADGYADETREIEVTADETTRVDLRLDREWGPGEGELEVAVVEPGGGSTLESRVTIYGNGEEHSTIAPAGSIPDGDHWNRGFAVAEGWWEVRASAVDGYGDGYAEVYVDPDATTLAIVEGTEEDRQIHRNGWVDGIITDADGRPVPDAVVRFLDDRSTMITMSSDDGRFEAELAHGQYAMDVDADGYERAETDVAVRFGRITTRDVTLESR